MPETAEPPSQLQAIVKSNDFSISEKQSLLMEICRAYKFALASGPRYSTKCLSPDTPVWTASGLALIGGIGKAPEGEFGAIREHVLSMSTDGMGIGLETADKFYNSGTRKAVSLKTLKGYELICSPNHRIWCECEGAIGFLSAEEICDAIANGKRVLAAMLRKHESFTKGYQTVEIEFPIGQRRGNRSAIQIDEEIAYLMGLFVGDGCYTPPVIKAFRAGFSTNDSELSNFVGRVITERFSPGSLKHCRGCDYQVQSSSFRAFLAATGMSGKYAHEKEVPPVIFKSPEPVIASFLRGLFDTDGMVCRQGSVRYSTSSLILARQVHSLLLGLGVRASRKFIPNDFRGSWLLCPCAEDQFHRVVGFGLSRKQERLTKHCRSFKVAFKSYPDSLVSVLKRLHATRRERGVGKLDRTIHKRVIGAVFRGNVSLSKKRIAPLVDALLGWNDLEFKRYWIDGKVWWDELAGVELVESPLVDISVPATENFVANGFINHNTVGCLHCVADHAWRTDRGNIALVSVSQSAGLDSGVWEDLVNSVIPQWINTGMGMQWVRKPFIANVTKKPTCEVSNRYGNRTRIQLDSLKYEHEVEARFKNKRYSMMYVTELSNFKNRKTFSIWGECLRMLHLKENQHLFLGDTNPADEGEESWIYKAFYLMPKIEYPDYVELCRKDGLPILQERAFNVMKATTKLLEFQIEDNIFATQERIDELVARYSDDQDLYDRYILGLWKRATTDALFAGVFRPAVHVIGDVESPSNSDPVIMIPQDSTYQLITGMDPGEAVNSAWALIEKVIRTLPNGKQISLFKILDELVIVGESHSLDDFSESVVEKMHWWQEHCGRNFEFSHWSDRSVFDMKEPRELKYYHQIIYEASGGEILLRAADRGAGTVRKRVALFRKLLFENRVFFNNAKCPMGIEMCRAMRKGPTETQVIAKGSKHKHIFDAITYAIASESYDEMEDMVWNSLKIKTTTNEPTLISIPA